MKDENVFLNYESPLVEVIEVTVEQGYQYSGNAGENYEPSYGEWENS